ncbi:MAG: fibronectin type III domain-containing protein [Acutalibacteraceae bacterium]
MEKEKSFLPLKSTIALMLAILMILSIFPAAIQAEAVSKPAQVKNLKATSVTYNSAKLSWSAVSGQGNYYMVFSYNAKTKKYTSLATTTSTTYTVKNLNPKTSYTFAVQAFRKSGSTRYWGKVSSKLTVTTKNLTLKKPVINSIKAGYGEISIAWNKVTNATKYRVYRREKSEESYSKLCDTTSLKYTDKTVVPGKMYYYRVRAFANTNNKSVYSECSDFKKLCTNTPATAKDVSLKKETTCFKISWNKVKGATGYEIYRSTTNKKNSYKKIATTKNNYYTDKGINKTDKYYYTIRSYKKINNKIYYSNFSAKVSGTLNIIYTECNKLTYATKDVPIKKSADNSSKTVATLKKNCGITTIGIGNNGWSKVVYTDSKTYYIESKYLSNKPKEQIYFVYWDTEKNVRCKWMKMV